MNVLAINRDEKRPPPRRRKSQFEVVFGICQHIVKFMEENEAEDCKVYFSLGPGKVDLYLVTTKVAYDFPLGDKLADFAAPYIERGLLTSVMLLPASTAEQLTAYFDHKTAIQLQVEKTGDA